MGSILGNDMDQSRPPVDPRPTPIVDPADPEFFTQMQPQLDQMAALLALIRQLRNR